MKKLEAFKAIGICGGGKMGMSFFKTISNLDLDITFYMRNTEKLNKAENSYRREVERKLRQNGGEPDGISRVKFTDNIDDLGSSDLIIEFVAEDLEVKRDIIGRLLQCRKKPEQVIATCSSSFKPSRLSKQYGKNNIFGIHFIYPVQYMHSVEVLYGEDSDRDELKRIEDFVKSLGKVPVLLYEEADVFSVKMLSHIQNEAFRLHTETGLQPEVIDSVIAESIAMPPFDMMDSVGFDIIHMCIREFYSDSEEYPYYKPLEEYMKRKLETGQAGKRTGKGFIDYTGSGNDSTKKDIDVKVRNQITERIKMVYIANCFRYLDKCWLDSVEADGIMKEVNQSAMGPVEMAFEQGIESVLKTLEAYESRHGLPFRPPGVLKYIAAKNIGRDEIDEQIRLSRMGSTRPGWYYPA